MERLEKRVEDLVRDWGVVIQGTLETQSSFIAFGKCGDQDVALKVMSRRPRFRLMVVPFTTIKKRASGL